MQEEFVCQYNIYRNTKYMTRRAARKDCISTLSINFNSLDIIIHGFDYIFF
jgi:hypothetical protein